MKSIFRLTLCLILGIQIISCSKDKEENTGTVDLKTTSVTVLSHRSAKAAGVITTSPSVIIQLGVCYSESPNPTLANNNTTVTPKLGTFTSDLNKLKANTKYYLRTYVVVESGTYYGEEYDFTTQDFPTENIWWLNENAYVINPNSLLPQYVWMADRKSFVGTDDLTEPNFISITFSQKPTKAQTYKLVYKEAGMLQSDECLLIVNSGRAPYIAPFTYTGEEGHPVEVTFTGNKSTINISEVELSNINDATQKVKFRAISLKEK